MSDFEWSPESDDSWSLEYEPIELKVTIRNAIVIPDRWVTVAIAAPQEIVSSSEGEFSPRNIRSKI